MIYQIYHINIIEYKRYNWQYLLIVVDLLINQLTLIEKFIYLLRHKFNLITPHLDPIFLSFFSGYILDSRP